ncbi:Nephrocystin-3 [Colletotrichum fructicola Nara gc5]|uniref:Nephrocystin-3 n=1 Tax=Colletotrichum fructicola (strain Nara gc5) TaxID=1213859 RepID=A0A7J6IBL4_COLFN|nr:Nephrocystin-3 [Colletotrichum fructicola Nara gc5]
MIGNPSTSSMDPSTHQRDITGNRFGDGAYVHQGDVHGSVHYHAPDVPATAKVAIRVLPFPRNEDVVIREDIFSEIERLLPFGGRGQTAALCGLGGTGKTQIALEYAYRRCANDTCSIFWVHADNETTFVQDYKGIAGRLGVADNLDGEALLTAVRYRIETEADWVLILDNADDLGLFGVGQPPAVQPSTDQSFYLDRFIPKGPSGTVLWTSRDKQIEGSLVGPRRAIDVARMTEDEAQTLLGRVRNSAVNEKEANDSRTLLAKLDWLPLAISQAAAYMRRTETSIPAYLSKLKKRKFLQRSEADPHRRSHVSNSVLQTWKISIEHIRRENKMAYNILHILAFLDGQNIPWEIVKKAGQFEGGTQHNDSMRSGNSTDDDTSEGDTSGSDSEGDEDVLHAVTRLFDEKALKLRRDVLGEKHPDTIDSMASLATTYHSQGRYDEAEKISVEVLELRRDVLGEKHPDTIWSMASLATTYHNQGRYDEAEKIKVEVLELRRDVLGEKHPDTIWSMASLAATYHSQGRYDEAEKIKVEVLELRRDVLGEKHPDTIWSMASLAATYHSQGRYDEAEKIKVEVLELRRDVLGEKHPDTIDSMAELATTYHSQGRYDEAEKFSVEVLELQRDVLGEKHPDTIRSMAELATTYHSQGRYDEAEKIKVEVLELRRDVLGVKHPDTIWSMAELATKYHSQGRYDEAEKISVETRYSMLERVEIRPSVYSHWPDLSGAPPVTPCPTWKSRRVP